MGRSPSLPSRPDSAVAQGFGEVEAALGDLGRVLRWDASNLRAFALRGAPPEAAALTCGDGSAAALFFRNCSANWDSHSGFDYCANITDDWILVFGSDAPAALLNSTGAAAPPDAAGAHRQCRFTGDTIQAKDASGAWTTWNTNNFPATTPCDADSVVMPGNARYAAIQARTTAAVNYWAGTVRIKPVRDAIVLDASLQTSFGVSGSFTDTDLVMIMTARPSPASPIAGFAICYQRDQRGRCTVGQFK